MIGNLTLTKSAGGKNKVASYNKDVKFSAHCLLVFTALQLLTYYLAFSSSSYQTTLLLLPKHNGHIAAELDRT